MRARRKASKKPHGGKVEDVRTESLGQREWEAMWYIVKT